MTRRTSCRKRRSCLQSTEISYDLFRLSRRSRCLCCYCCLFPRSGRGWLGVHFGIEGGSRPLMWRQPRSRDTARRERGDQSQSGNTSGEVQPSADVGGLPCRGDGGLGGLGGHPRPGGYDDQVRAVRVQAGDSLGADEHEARLGGHGYPAQLWAVRASASFCIPPNGGELPHVLGHAVLYLRRMSIRTKVRQSLAFINGSTRVLPRIHP